MGRLSLALIGLLLASTVQPVASATGTVAVEEGGSYAEARRVAAARRTAVARRWRRRGLDARGQAAAEAAILRSVKKLSRLWLGTRWGLGVPQSSTPGPGQINCGTFVGTVLRDAGFNVAVKKLQRQPSQLIIESFVGGDRVRKFSNAKMTRFLASVREMGPGLFIIGLDFHVGLLIQTETDLRFVHASYETKTVIDEPAATATPIVTSKYRVVGKLLSRQNLRDWLAGNRIQIKGNW